MKLIYWNADRNDSTSPFEEEIFSIVNGKDVSIVSPYINLQFLNKLISLTNSWKLVTDLEAWILSYSQQESRLEISEFIKNNRNNIKHVESVHAKVILTNGNALLGSANFTNNGINKNIEMSVSFNVNKEVKEMQKWFDNLWAKNTLPDEYDIALT